MYVVLLPWKLCSWLLTDTELVNDNQCAMQWRYRLQIIINDRLVLRKLSQHVSGVVYMCIQIKFIRKHTSKHSVTRLKLVYVVLLPWKTVQLVIDRYRTCQWQPVHFVTPIKIINEFANAVIYQQLTESKHNGAYLLNLAQKLLVVRTITTMTIICTVRTRLILYWSIVVKARFYFFIFYVFMFVYSVRSS